MLPKLSFDHCTWNTWFAWGHTSLHTPCMLFACSCLGVFLADVVLTVSSVCWFDRSVYCDNNKLWCETLFVECANTRISVLKGTRCGGVGGAMLWSAVWNVDSCFLMWRAVCCDLLWPLGAFSRHSLRLALPFWISQQSQTPTPPAVRRHCQRFLLRPSVSEDPCSGCVLWCAAWLPAVAAS